MERAPAAPGGRRAAITGDETLERLHAELAAYPGVHTEPPATTSRRRSSCRCGCAAADDELSLICTQTTFGTAVDVTLAELSIEGFYPADEETARRYRQLSTA